MMDWKEKAIDMTNKDIISQDFDSLVSRIQNTSDILQQDARLVINRNVTTRAWLTGFYIVEYEQHGSDRAKYGENLLQNLSKRLDGKSFGLSNLKNYRQFYLEYAQLAFPVRDYLISRFGKRQTLSVLFQGAAILLTGKSQSVNGLFQNTDNQTLEKSHSLNGLFEENHPQSVSRDGFAMQLASGEVMPVPQMLFSRLSFTHIVQLLHLNDPLKRTFYAIEAMRGPWSVRELQRQIDSNYYERSGWSKKPDLLAQKVNDKAEKPCSIRVATAQQGENERIPVERK